MSNCAASQSRKPATPAAASVNTARFHPFICIPPRSGFRRYNGRGCPNGCAPLPGTYDPPVELLTRPLDELMAEARAAREAARGRLVTYSPKVFIPLTKLCRDVCHYCTFARPPRRGERAYMTIDEVLEVARAGEAAGCREALFTLGDKPELRYAAACEELR